MDFFGATTSTEHDREFKSSKDQLNWLFVDLNSYFASVEQQLRPELRGRPVAVVPMMAETTSCLAASYEAKKFGVKTGVSVADSRKMCPGIQFVEADHRRYVEYHDRIVEAVESCLPVYKVMSIDEMACRLTGRDQKLENAIALGKEVKQKILAQVGECLTSSVGIASSRFLAKVASDMQKPDGLTVLKPEDLPHKLYSLKPRDFPGIGFSMEARLHQHGVTTVEQLFQKDIHQMRAIWGGVTGEHYYRRIRGEDLEFQYEVGKTIGHSNVLAPQFRNEKGSYAIAMKMLHKTAYRLRDAKRLTRKISLGIYYLNRTYWHQFLNLSGCQDTHTLNDAFQKLWKMKPSGTPLKVSVTLSDFLPEEERSLSFFDDPKRENASKAMDLLNKKYKKHLLYLADMHETRDLVKNKIAFSSVPKFDVD